jgi:acyl-CoA dehydrogenase
MDFKLTEEEKLVQRTAAQFVERELLPLEGQFLKQTEAFLPPGDPPRRDFDPQIRKSLVEKAKRVGLWAWELPEDARGSGIGALARVLIYREFGRTILPFAPAYAPALLAGSRYAKPIADDALSLSPAFGQIHKTGAADDIKTHFRETPEGYQLSNTTIDVADPKADLYLFPAREPGSERAGLFVLERSLPGLTIEDEVDLTTDATIAKMTLRDCKVSREQLVGYEYDVGALIAAEQLRIAARCLGIGARCLAESLEHARNRVTFGRPLASRQAIQWMLADLSIHLRASTWLTMEAAWRTDHDMPYFSAASLAKKRSAKMAFEAADVAIQIHGGYGVCKEFPFEGFYREARMMRLLYGREAEIDRAIGERFLEEGMRR